MRRGRFADLPIRRKLVAIGVVAATFALLLACGAFVAYDRTSFMDSFAEKLETQAAILGRNSAASIVFDDRETASRILGALGAERSVLDAAIYTARGRQLARFTPSGPSSLPERWLQWGGAPAIAEGAITVHEPIVFDGDLLGTVVVRASLAQLEARTLRFATIAAIVLAIALVVAYVVSARLQRFISEPVLRLSETAELVRREKNYSTRAVVSGRDEIGNLVTAFNGMLETIEHHERELESARDTALESVRLKSAFLANMSHEIRTPLNVILGYNDLIADHFRAERNTGYASMVERISSAGHRLTTTINGILDLSRMEADSFDTRPIPLHVATVVRNAMEEARVLANRKGLELDEQIELPDLVVVFDDYCLSQILLNLLSNAIKFTPGGSWVRLYRAGDGHPVLSVLDSGIGIDPAFLGRLFEAFTQEDIGDTRSYEGSGLGLTLVQRYASLNQATVSVESAKGAGSTFSIHFDAASETREPVAPEPDRVAPLAPTPRSGNATVLVVEDDPDSQAFVRDLLARDWIVIGAPNAESALQQLALHGEQIAVVLMDVSLRGGMDGLTLTRHLRAGKWESLPIVAMTAHAFREDRTRCLAAGCDAYLSKPIEPAALRGILARLERTRPGSARAASGSNGPP